MFNLKVEEVEEDVHCSAEAEVRYQKVTEDIEAGSNVTETKSVDEHSHFFRKVEFTHDFIKIYKES